MEIVSVEYHDRTAVLKLSHGVINAINLELVKDLSAILQGVEEDSEVEGLVLCSSNEKFFSIGFDIPRLLELSRKEFRVFYRAFNQFCLDLYTLPKPTVAAITGHAIAGGCILALCCDYRLVAEGKKLMGLNEILLGVPVPYLADCILQQITGARIAHDIMVTGEFYPPEVSLNMGLVDAVLPSGQILEKSIEKAGRIGALHRKAFELIKRNHVEAVEAQFLARREEKEGFFIECWYSDTARKQLELAKEKF